MIRVKSDVKLFLDGLTSALEDAVTKGTKGDTVRTTETQF